jgi:hypothetical protein
MQEIKKEMPELRTWQLPSISEMLEAEHKPYPYAKTYAEVEDETAVIIHSSGSTGMHLSILKLIEAITHDMR